MRMQNTDMEFVTFDAQDVIATSGPTPDPCTQTSTVHFVVNFVNDTIALIEARKYNTDSNAWESYTLQQDEGYAGITKGNNTLLLKFVREEDRNLQVGDWVWANDSIQAWVKCNSDHPMQ